MEQYLLDEKTESSGFDIKRFAKKIIKNYYWFILSVLVCLVGAYTYLRYTIPLYQVATFIQIQQTDGANLLGGSPFPNQASSAPKEFDDINSEIFKLKSASLVAEVVDSLNLYVEVMKKGRVKNKPVYHDHLPVKIDVKKSIPNAQTGLFRLDLFKTHYVLSNPTQNYYGHYQKPLIINSDTIILELNQYPKLPDVYWLFIDGKSNATSKYLSRLTVGMVPKGGAGMIQVLVKDEIPLRAKQFADALIHRHDVANFEFKNKALKMEMEFLSNRLSAVSTELEAQENQIKNFKADNKINDVSTSANQLLSSLTTIDIKKSENRYKEDLLRLIEANIQAENDQEERLNVPGLQDVELINLVSKYNELVIEKRTILSNGAPKDLRLAPLNAKLAETKRNVALRIQSIRDELQASNAFLAVQERNTNGEFIQLPTKEKDYIAVNRLLNIKQALYVFLLQRKEDKDIEFASAGFVGSRIVDWRANTGTPDPKPLIIFSAALAAGLLIPLLIILLRFLLNNRIETSDEIFKTTSIPVVGEISHEKLKKQHLIIDEQNTLPIAEQFRTLRTNIFYWRNDIKKKIFLFTSAMSGEGKSFISLNLANTIAISDKKTVLVELDLRNPTLGEKLGITGNPGISDYLSNAAGITEIIQPVENHKNFYFISAGQTLVTNPGEIILNSRMEPLFEYLRKNFQYVLLDTPPIEAVSDALSLGKWADMSFYIIRHKYSLKSSLTLINKLNEDSKLPPCALIINGIRRGEGFRNSYGYGYKGKHGGKKKKEQPKLRIA